MKGDLLRIVCTLSLLGDKELRLQLEHRKKVTGCPFHAVWDKLLSSLGHSLLQVGTTINQALLAPTMHQMIRTQGAISCDKEPISREGLWFSAPISSMPRKFRLTRSPFVLSQHSQTNLHTCWCFDVLLDWCDALMLLLIFRFSRFWGIRQLWYEQVSYTWDAKGERFCALILVRGKAGRIMVMVPVVASPGRITLQIEILWLRSFPWDLMQRKMNELRKGSLARERSLGCFPKAVHNGSAFV